jgi:hypothetical protein
MPPRGTIIRRTGVFIRSRPLAAYLSFHVRVCSLSSASETWTGTGTRKRGGHGEVHQQAFRRAAATFSRPGRHSEGGNLFLAIDKTGRRRWTFLWRRGGKTHEIGLGPASAVSLARARELASEYRDGLAKGVSPLERREAERRARDGKKTFGACADALLDAKSSEWRNAKHRAQWKMTLEEYAKPLRALPVDGVTMFLKCSCHVLLLATLPSMC